ncbi:MAG: HAD family hydrolase [Desulfobacterales bacterium]|nr:HAD family hydrolase [Desulfobacterales bacterium]MDX2513413.1 HAD family hydrolase [Desulfobacterales bacterium]
MKVQVDAVLFDLDGTILDSIGIYYQIIEIVLKRLDIPMPSKDKIRDAAKNGDFEWDQMYPGKTPKEKALLFKEIRGIIDEIYPTLFGSQAKLITNAKEALETISQKGIKLGIVTSTPRENMKIKLYPLVDSGIKDLMEVIITADDAPRKKPAPDPLIESCKRLGILPKHAMYVGDSRTDIQAGKAAGMKTVGVLTGFDNRETLGRENPDAIIDSIADLKNILV